MHQYQQLLESLSPEIYARLKAAVETGRWPDGRRLSVEQRQTCLQAVIAYDARHRAEADRIGQVDPQAHGACKKTAEEASGADDRDRPLRWRQGGGDHGQ